MVKLIDDARRRGLLRDGISTEDLIFSSRAFIYGVARMWIDGHFPEWLIERPAEEVSAIVCDGKASDAPILHRDLINHNKGRGGVFVQNAYEQICNSTDEFRFLFPRRTFVRYLDVHIGHFDDLPYCGCSMMLKILAMNPPFPVDAHERQEIDEVPGSNRATNASERYVVGCDVDRVDVIAAEPFGNKSSRTAGRMTTCAT